MFAYIIYPKLTTITVRTHDKIGPRLNSFRNIIVINKVTTINIVLLINIFLTPFLDKFVLMTYISSYILVYFGREKCNYFSMYLLILSISSEL